MATPISSYTPQVSAGTTMSWLPITSAWPSIAECSIGHWPLDGLAVAFDPSIGANNTLLRCLPTETSLWWTQATPSSVFTVTSLGPLVCPSAYYVASRSVINPDYFYSMLSVRLLILRCSSTRHICQRMYIDFHIGISLDFLHCFNEHRALDFDIDCLGNRASWAIACRRSQRLQLWRDHKI